MSEQDPIRQLAEKIVNELTDGVPPMDHIESILRAARVRIDAPLEAGMRVVIHGRFMNGPTTYIGRITAVTPSGGINFDAGRGLRHCSCMASDVMCILPDAEQEGEVQG